MKIFSKIFDVLGKSDSQGRDWYGWSTNQCSHALFGVFIALLFPGAPLAMALIVALMKEMFDLMRDLTKETAIDSGVDVVFWLIGASVIAFPDPVVGIILMFFGLIIGIIPRYRKVLKDAPDIE